MRYPVRGMVLAVICLVLTSACGWCVPTVVKESTLVQIKGCPFRPRISGDWVVTVQNQDAKGCGSVSIGVILHNLVSGKAYTVYQGAAGWCAAGGTLVTWTGKTNNIKGFCTLKGDRSGSGNPTNLILLDTRDWRYYTPPITTGPAFAPVVCGDFVAYEGMNSHIYLCDMNTGGQFQISQDGTKNNNPQIGQDLVVWEEHTNKRQIRGYRISAAEFLKITDDAGEENTGCDTDGKTVVWGNKGINIYDVAAGISKKISPTGYFADVDNGIVVYLKPVNKKAVVFGYDLAAQEEFRISSGNSNCGPSISGNRVIWCWDGRIHVAELDRSGKKLLGK